MKKSNKMSVFYSEENGECTFFFKGNVCVGCIHGNDAEWRHEYLNPVVKNFGLEVVSLNSLNQAQRNSASDKYPDYFE